MARKVSDILPLASGRYHIGVEGGTSAGSFAQIVPFGNIHQLSGVFHHAGSSGVLRFNNDIPSMQVSNNGGRTFDNLASSGALISAVTLQRTYLAVSTDESNNGGGFVIDTNAAGGNGTMHLTAMGRKLAIASWQGRAPFRFSGVLEPQNQQNTYGDFNFMLRGDSFSSTPPATVEASNAQARGLYSFIYDCGSGITQFMHGSGLAQFRNSSSTFINVSVTGPRIGFDLTDLPDNHCVAFPGVTDVVSGSGIKFFAHGLYQITYTMNLNNGVSTARRLMRCNATLNNDTNEIPGSVSYTYNRIDSAGQGTGHTSFFVNISPNDAIYFHALFSSAAGTDEVSTIGGESVVLVEYKGVKRTMLPPPGT